MPNIVGHLLLVFGTVAFGLTVKSQSLTIRSVLFAVATSIYVSILFVSYPDDDNATHYFVSFTGACLLAVAFDLLMLQCNPQDTLKHNCQDKNASQLPFISRLKWGATLLINVRGANWNCAVPGLRYPQATSRRHIYTRRHPAFQHPPLETFGARGLLWQSVNVMVYWTTMVACLNRIQTMISAVLVALGLSEPEDWPTIFGEWSQTKCVRAFWGKSCHQGLRRTIQPQSKYLINNVLGVAPGTLQSKYTQLFMCFLLSGVYHATADWFTIRSCPSAQTNIKFFVSQAAFIMLEDFVIFIGGRLGQPEFRVCCHTHGL
ncbi:membrane bound O-acyl transferase family-domain-containing protein [Cyathus striatus]|nr:membrane bound O-acyl transferase family-domain-containing protein [Cyathus striatus]